MRTRFGKASEKVGSRIVIFCGFDSIPSDLAVFVAVWAQREQRGDDVCVRRAKTWHSNFGFANGGTIHTALDVPVDLKRMLFDERTEELRRVPHLADHPFHLAPEEARTRPEYDTAGDATARAEWFNQL